jgi:CxxC motif-containing protein (DUF1111 family)
MGGTRGMTSVLFGKGMPIGRMVMKTGLYMLFVAGLLLAGVFVAGLQADDVLKSEPGEELPGGATTAKCCSGTSMAFMQPPPNMDGKRGLDWRVGRGMFKKIWVSAPASTKASDGLGPLYNARSCMRCHPRDGRGHPPKANWPKDDSISMFLRLSIPPQTSEQKKLMAEHKLYAVPDPTYGGQLQDLAIQGHEAEGKMHITYAEHKVELAGGEQVSLRVPSYKITNWGYGKPHKQLMISPRIAPQMIGLGLLEAIPAKQIMANADPLDKDGDGISGKVSRVWSHKENKVMVGRYGWKAITPTLFDQGDSAMAGDIGISNPVFPHASGDCTDRQTHCMDAPNGNMIRDGDLEIGPKLNNVLMFYSRNLAVPKRHKHDDPTVLQGKALFNGIGCTNCHKPNFITSESAPGGKHLSNQKIWPYSDLLLHDMGQGLSDNRPVGNALGSEWRTAPLWGIGQTKTVSGHTYFLHDGRARGIKEAILWHGGEAKAARDAFAGLDKKDRERLIAFVNSL